MSTTFRLFKNTGWAILAKLASRISHSLIAIIVSRLIGVSATGAYHIGLTYFTLGLSFAVWGFDQNMILEVSKDRSLIYKYFGNLIIIQTLFGLVTFAVIFLISFIAPYPPQTKLLVQIFSLSIISESIILICQAVFMSFEEVKGISIVNTILAVIKVVGIFFMVYIDGGLIEIAWVWTAISFLSMGIFIFLTRQYLPKRGFKIDWRFGISILINSSIIFLISTLYAIDSRVDVLLLSFISDEFTLGLFTSALAISSFFFLFPQAFRDVVYPILSRLHHSDKKSTEKLYTISTKYLLIMTLPMAAGICVLAPEIILLIYGEKFINASILLSISIWMLPLYALMSFNTGLLIVDYKGKYVNRLLSISIVANAVLNLILFPVFGIVASTFIRVASSLIVTLPILLIVNKQLYKTGILKLILKLSLPVVLMGTVVYFTKTFSIVISIILGVIFYFVLLYLFHLLDQDDISLWKNLYANFAKEKIK